MKNSLVFTLLCLVGAVASPGETATSQGTPSNVPNPKLTPGVVREVTKDDLCDSRYRSYDGSLSVTVKRKVFDVYGVNPQLPVAYNVDHLIPVSLGGTNAIENLWPQPLAGEWNHLKKNLLERRLYKLVCSGSLDLQKVQQEIATDWVVAYRKYIGETQSKR